MLKYDYIFNGNCNVCNNNLGINSVQLLGRVGQFPKKGKGDVWRFPLATNTTYQSKDEFGGS